VEQGKFEKSENVFSTVELLRKDTFKEWNEQKPLVKTAMRHVFAKNDQVLEIGAGTGSVSRWLNETGWVMAYAFDYAQDIEVVSFGRVKKMPLPIPHPDTTAHAGEVLPVFVPLLGGEAEYPYDWFLCLNPQCLLAVERAGGWGPVAEKHLAKGVVVARNVLRETLALDAGEERQRLDAALASGGYVKNDGLTVEWYIKLFLSVNFSANWVSVH
jgi:hypothetical protein